MRPTSPQLGAVKRVGYVLRYFPTLSENFVYREIAQMQALGIDVVVIALGRRADGAANDELPAVEVRRPKLRPLRWTLRGLDRLHVHFAGEAAEWAAATGLPYSVTVHANDLFKPRPSLGDVLRQADHVVTVCDHHRTWLRRYDVDAVVVRCGIDPGRYLPADPAGDPGVICVARDVPKKGIPDLRRACAALDLPLEVVSDLPPSQIPARLAASTIFALACRIADDGDRDGMPVALLEAMASGLPVVTTAVAGIPEVVDDTVGWLVPPDAPDALEAALRDARDHPDERVRRGVAGRERVTAREYTVARQAEALLALWTSP